MELPERTESLWLATEPEQGFPQLEGDLAVDVAIVGGGITGITAATLLKRAGLTVAVIEAKRVGHGVTGGTTAHLTEAVDTRYYDLIKKHGEQGARLVAESSRAAIEQIATLVRDGRIACGFRRLPGYLYTERAADAGEIERECEAARRLGLEVSMTREVPLPFGVAAAARWENQAQFHPLQYLASLAGSLPGAGSHVFEGTRVLDVDDGAPCRVVTERGVVSARHVIVATHAPVNTRFFLQTKLVHYRSYVVAVTLASPPPVGLFWDTDDPYHYIRTQPAGGRDVVIVGGEDHRTGHEEHTEARYDALLDYVRARFDVASVEHRWSAQVVEPVDGLPYIGRSSFSTRVFVAAGYSGNGMTFGTIAAMLLADTVLGRANPWKNVYTATRFKPLASAKDFVTENAAYPAHMVSDRLRAPGARSLAEVAPGEGKIVKVGRQRLAVYRDDAGGLHALSPVCTHMGCHVHFNDAEKTWDCPCHGSRFTTGGEVIDGPAVRALERKHVEDDGHTTEVPRPSAPEVSR